MATPPELVELRCPQCSSKHWEWDSLVMGVGDGPSRSERAYDCPRCAYRGPQYETVRTAPSLFYYQPHPLHPMPVAEFAYWADILLKVVPGHRYLRLFRGNPWYTKGWPWLWLRWQAYRHTAWLRSKHWPASGA